MSKLTVILKSVRGLTFLLVATACTSPPVSVNQAEAPNVDRTLKFEDIDPSIYFVETEAEDPFASVYQGFRERRAADMQDTTRPPPIKPYQSVHLNADKPWNDLSDVFQFDWSSLGKDSVAAVEQLRSVLRVKRVFDHPDLKIIQLMVGAGATLPAYAEGAPGVFLVTGGSGEITVDGKTQTVSPGTKIKLEPYAVRSLYAEQGEALKLLWIRWAPNGDHRYIKAGYYLTGANQHVQAEQATIPEDYEFWGKKFSTTPVVQAQKTGTHSSTAKVALTQQKAFEEMRAALGTKHLQIYPDVEVFGHESEKPWLNLETIASSNLMWAKDVISTGALVERWSEVVRMESVFQAHHGDGRWDFNISQQAWGSGARYVEHSHSIPEFYYIVSGSVQHWNGDTAYDAQPGDVYMTNSFQNHESRVRPNGETWRSYGATWAPNGDRSVFNRPHFLLAALPKQPAGAVLASDATFH